MSNEDMRRQREQRLLALEKHAEDAKKQKEDFERKGPFKYSHIFTHTHSYK